MGSEAGDSKRRGREVKITPLDIRRKEFKRSMRGYADEEVDVFLDEVADEFERLERKASLQFFAERLGQVRHRCPARDAMDIKPFEQLGHAILGLLPGGELRFQFLARQRFDVLQHPRNLTGAGWETKRIVSQRQG